jgi:predicted amidophosphoribosyltransferase
VRTAVHRLKFAGWRPVAQALGEAMATVWTPSDVDVVTWVPLSPRRRAERGFDQAHELASVVAPRLGLPALALLARDADDRSTQARRDRAGRLAAMEGRFRVRVPVRGTVLLVDDVLTTGATASACAAVLERGGADRVYVLTAARALTPRPSAALPAAREGTGILGAGPASGSVVARGSDLR